MARDFAVGPRGTVGDLGGASRGSGQLAQQRLLRLLDRLMPEAPPALRSVQVLSPAFARIRGVQLGLASMSFAACPL